MLRMVVALGLAASLFCAGISGCTWMGKTTGQAVHGMEEGANDFQKGYNEGVGNNQSKQDKKFSQSN